MKHFLLLWAFAVTVALANNPIVDIRRVDAPPQLRDYLTGTPAEAGSPIAEFRQRDPHDGQPVSQTTKAYLSYDRDAIYAVFVCQANRSTLRARLSKRDNLSGDESVSLMLDTFHDRRRAYMFYVNPLGVQLDGITTEGQEDDDFSFDTVWHSEARLTAFGYVAKIAIPFRSLRFAGRPGDTWGIALSRYIPNHREFAAFPYITNRIEGFVNQFATLRGLNALSRPRNLQLNPYGFFGRQRFLDDAGPDFIQQSDARAGVDAKLVLRDAFTLDVTVNPDFSQVESDEPQVTANQRFEVYFPERRPFFLENAGYFETPETLFFSRRVQNPQFGARLTGKVGRWAIGLLTADDRGPRGLRPAETPRTHLAVARVQREFGKNSMVGGIFTTHQQGAVTNNVFSFDTRWRLNQNWVVTGQAVRSQDPRWGAGSLYYSEVRHTGRNLTYFTQYRDRSASFHAPLGFIPRVDIRQQRSYAAYRWRPETGPVLNYGPSGFFLMNWDHAGRLQDWAADVPFRIEFKGPAALEVSRNESYEYYRNAGFRKNYTRVMFSTDALRVLGFTGSWASGRDVNFYPGAGIAPFATSAQFGSALVRWRPSPRLRIDETYYYTKLGSAPAVLINHLWRSKVNYQFTRALSWRWIMDYEGNLPNSALVEDERRKRLRNDLLLTYLVQPGTALQAGYSDSRENLVLPDLQRLGGPQLMTGRMLFVKISYLFRL